MLAHKLSAINHYRQSSAPLPTGIAPKVSSDSYRFPSAEKLGLARRWDDRLSVESRSRGGATLKDNASSKAASNAVNLGTARPAASNFPWTSIIMQSNNTVDCDTSEMKKTSCFNGEQGFDLGLAMNYGKSHPLLALPRLLQRLADLRWVISRLLRWLTPAVALHYRTRPINTRSTIRGLERLHNLWQYLCIGLDPAYALRPR